MGCYLVANIVIDDRKEYKKNERRIFRHLRKYGGELLCVDDNPETIDGKDIDGRLLIMKFSTKQVAKNWFFDKDYQEMAKKYRYHCSEVKFVSLLENE